MAENQSNFDNLQGVSASEALEGQTTSQIREVPTGPDVDAIVASIVPRQVVPRSQADRGRTAKALESQRTASRKVLVWVLFASLVAACAVIYALVAGAK